jgi:hypothetical protein
VADTPCNPLDLLLRQVSESAASDRVRAWAGRLIAHGEAVTGGGAAESAEGAEADNGSKLLPGLNTLVAPALRGKKGATR